MQNARYNPMIPQSIVVGKAQPDLHSFREREKVQGRKAYPGGTVPANLAIIPGEILLARRNCRNTSGAYGRTSQCAFSSLSGITLDDKNSEQLTRSLMFVGIAQNEYMYGGDNLFGTDPLDHGFGFIFSGSFTTVNTGHTDIHAFDKLCWKVPSVEPEPRSQGVNGPNGIDNGFNPLKRPENRIGVPGQKVLVEVERYDPKNFAMPIANTFDLIRRPRLQGGILNVTPQDYFNSANYLDTAQEEAYGTVWAILTVAKFANPVGDYGLNDGVLTDDAIQLLGRVFGRNVFPGSNVPNEANRKGDLSDQDKTLFFQDHVFDLWFGAVGGAMAAKQDTIIGTALGSAKPNKSLDMVIRM